MKKLNFLITALIILIATIVIMLILLVMSFINKDEYKIEDSVVFIDSKGNETMKNGMGFVYKIDEEYTYIVTNYHVINEATKIFVSDLKNNKQQASLINFDAYTDIAILEINDSLNFKEVKFSSNDIKLNDEVYYCDIYGNIDTGKILSTNNEINISTDYGISFYNAGMIQGNIYNGNSGGGLFNLQNEIIGMISLKEENTDNAYYIPIKDVMEIVTKLENHTLVRPNLGGIFISSTNIAALNENAIQIPNISGVVVGEVVSDYPLSIAGFIKGDIITKINDTIITDVIDMQKEIYSHNLGDTLIVEYYRNDILNTTNIILNK